MSEIVTAIIAAIPSSALPLLVCVLSCVLGCCFIYLKIGKDRKQTKEERDGQKDELDKRLTLVEHDVCYMKQQHALFADKLDRILDELTAIKVELAKKAEKQMKNLILVRNDKFGMLFSDWADKPIHFEVQFATSPNASFGTICRYRVLEP